MFPKLLTPMDMITYIYRRTCFRAIFFSQRVNWSQTVQKSVQQLLHAIFWPLSDKFSWKMSLLLRSEILGLFVNTLTVYDRYSLYNREKFQQSIQMQLSKNPKKEHFKAKENPRSLSISEIAESERHSYLNVWKVFLQSTLQQSTF